MKRSNQLWGFGVLAVGVALLATAACSSTLGIDEAHLDPTFSEPGKTVKSDQGGGECKGFDNKRLKHLEPDGSLSPLPSR
jgi:hypothetical protein